MKIDFWQLSEDGPEKVIALIAARVLDAGERMLVISADAEQRARITRALWRAGAESFLANGEAAGAGAALQPVLLSDTIDAIDAAGEQGAEAANSSINGVSHVVFADGTYRDPTGFDRAFLLFDETTRQAARKTWSSLGDATDSERSFYRQDAGKWVKVA